MATLRMRCTNCNNRNYKLNNFYSEFLYSFSRTEFALQLLFSFLAVLDSFPLCKECFLMCVCKLVHCFLIASGEEAAASFFASWLKNCDR